MLLMATLLATALPARHHARRAHHTHVCDPVTAEITVIQPPLLRDAQAWPRGMVIVPPDTGDRMVILAPRGDLLAALFTPFAELLRPAAPTLL